MIKKVGLRCLRLVKCQDNADWVKHCVTVGISEARQEGVSQIDLVGCCQAEYKKCWPVLRIYTD